MMIVSIDDEFLSVVYISQIIKKKELLNIHSPENCKNFCKKINGDLSDE